jgi:hypothetical protein
MGFMWMVELWQSPYAGRPHANTRTTCTADGLNQMKSSPYGKCISQNTIKVRTLNALHTRRLHQFCAQPLTGPFLDALEDRGNGTIRWGHVAEGWLAALWRTSYATNKSAIGG